MTTTTTGTTIDLIVMTAADTMVGTTDTTDTTDTIGIIDTTAIAGIGSTETVIGTNTETIITTGDLTSGLLSIDLPRPRQPLRDHGAVFLLGRREGTRVSRIL
jgi:hypothetical protein